MKKGDEGRGNEKGEKTRENEEEIRRNKARGRNDEESEP